MPFKILIEADNLAIAQAALNGVVRALAEETGPAVTSDQAPSDIVQNEDQAELPLAQGAECKVDEGFGTDVKLIGPSPVPPPVQWPAPVAEPKKRGRKPKLVPAPVEDVEPPPEVITQEEEPEAEGAVDTPEPEPETTGVTEAQLRETVREIMDAKGIPAAIEMLAQAGYKQVKDIPPADYDRVHALLKSRDVLDAG